MCYGCNNCNKCGKLDNPKLRKITRIQQRCFKCGTVLQPRQACCPHCGAAVMRPPGTPEAR